MTRRFAIFAAPGTGSAWSPARWSAAGGPSRQTRVVSAGSPGAILATSGANAAAKIRQRQSNRSSSSRFSAASLRGLTGHQTAPARLMPNTQPKATGSLPDRTATLSPGLMPDLASALPTDQDSRRTSA